MKGELTAYYVDYGYSGSEYDVLLPILTSEYPDLTINTTVFTTQEEFTQTVMMELNAGKGPDLFLINFGTYMSFEKMSRNGTYLNLSPYMEADPSYHPDNYFEAAMQAGQINGRQHILPLAFTHMNLFTTKEKLNEMGVSLSEDSTWLDIMKVLSDSVDRAGQNLEAVPIATLLDRNDFDYMFLSGFGIPIVDMDKGQVVLEKEDYRIIADFVKKWFPFYREPFTQKINLVSNTQKYSEVDYSLCNNSVIRYSYYTQQIDNILEQETVSIPFPAYDGSSSTVGQMYMYTAVNANSPNKQLAYNAARALMDLSLTPSEVTSGLNSSFPICKQALHDFLETSSQNSCKVEVDGQWVTFLYDEETNREILNTVEQIDSVVIDDFSISYMFMECINGYLLDTRTFDECWNDLVNRLTLYINE